MSANATIRKLSRVYPLSMLKYLEFQALKGSTSSHCYNHPNKMQLEITNRCNLNCAMCPRRNEIQSKGYGKAADMSFENYRAIVDQFRNLQIFHVFGRGEPLMHPEVSRMIAYAKERKIPFVSITTNGQLLNRARADALARSGLDELRVSIDGADPESYRKVRNADLGRLVENLKYFSSICDIPLQVNFVLSRLNQDSVDGMPAFAASLGARRLHIFIVSENENVCEQGINIAFDGDEEQRLTRKMREEGRKSNIEVSISGKVQFKRCHAPFVNGFIDVEGYFTPCCKLLDVQLENVFEHGVFNAWNGQKMKAWRKALAMGRFPLRCREVKCVK